MLTSCCCFVCSRDGSGAVDDDRPVGGSDGRGGYVASSTQSGGQGGAGATSVIGSGGRRSRRVPSLRLANGRLGVSAAQSSEDIHRSPPQSATIPPHNTGSYHRDHYYTSAHPRLAKDDSIKISIENTNTCTDSLVTALDDETLLIADFLSNDTMNYKGSGKVHFGVDDVSLYGTPKEEPGPTPIAAASVASGASGQDPGKQSFIKNQLQALFQPTDNKLAMKLFGSKKALMKERIRQKAAGHWVIHPCSSFR